MDGEKRRPAPPSQSGVPLNRLSCRPGARDAPSLGRQGPAYVGLFAGEADCHSRAREGAWRRRLPQRMRRASVSRVSFVELWRDSPSARRAQAHSEGSVLRRRAGSRAGLGAGPGARLNVEVRLTLTARRGPATATNFAELRRSCCPTPGS